MPKGGKQISGVVCLPQLCNVKELPFQTKRQMFERNAASPRFLPLHIPSTELLKQPEAANGCEHSDEFGRDHLDTKVSTKNPR